MGYINYHAHSPMMFWIGQGAEKGNGWVESWWNKFIQCIERILSPDDISSLSDASALAYLDANISEVWDMYFHEEQIANSLAGFGITVHAGEAIMKNNPLGISAEESIEKTEKILKISARNSHVKPVVGYIGPYVWASDKNLTEKSVQIALKHSLPVHTHGAGSMKDYLDTKKFYKSPPIQVLEDFGFFSREIPEIVIAHCAYLDKTEFKILEKYRKKIKIAVCPRASTKLKYNKTPVRELLERKIEIVLGTDGASPSGIPDMKTETCLASESYYVPISYFSNLQSPLNPARASPEQRKEIIKNWHKTLVRLADKSGLTGKLREEFLNSRNYLAV